MEQNPYLAPSSSLKTISGLGDVVFRCRVRSEMEKVEALGQSTFGVHVQALLVPLFLLMMIAGLLSNLEKPGAKISPEYVRKWFAVGSLIYVLVIGAWYWFLYRRPRRLSLAYHEQGIRFEPLEFRFDQIASIHSGRTLSGSEETALAANRFLARFRFLSRSAGLNEHAAVMTEQYKNAALTVVLKDGTAWALKGVAIHNDPADLKRVFAMIARDHPEIKLAVESPDLPFGDQNRSGTRTDSLFDGPNPKILQL